MMAWWAYKAVSIVNLAMQNGINSGQRRTSSLDCRSIRLRRHVGICSKKARPGTSALLFPGYPVGSSLYLLNVCAVMNQSQLIFSSSAWWDLDQPISFQPTQGFQDFDRHLKTLGPLRVLWRVEVL